uniref:Glucanase n=2 Tax=Alexandrium monilatum TaxID=311494 RepID=A0A7S4RK95_9DINO
MEAAPTAIWVDRTTKISGRDPNTMEGALAHAASKDPPELVTFILYNLPNRDCDANASSGELCCNAECDFAAPGDCLYGLSRYVTEFIDPIAELLRRYAELVPVVLVLEPDSLPSLATNADHPRCGSSSTRASYMEGVRYAVDAISRASSSVALYADAGNSGWLGWKSRMAEFVRVVQDLGVAGKLRGFACNVANYNPLGVMCPTFDWCLNSTHTGDACCEDSCGELQDYNPSVNEHNYALHLVTAMSKAIPGFSPRVVVDTSRNGAPRAQGQCKVWCNPRGAGSGPLPTSSTSHPDVLDAYFWLKMPGESDGCTEFMPDGTRCPRFDAACNSSGSVGTAPGEGGAPEAGLWFDLMAQELAANARLA